MKRADRRQGRDPRIARPVETTLGFHRLAEGSILYRTGGTVVLATASIDSGVPDFLKGKGRGWITAEYQMHPRSNPHRREGRDGRGRPLGGRTQEIQRLIGRALRAGLVPEALGERTVVVDCDVLEADGGTRTASITAGFIALSQALHRLSIRALRAQVAAISVGIVDDSLALDLCYAEDSAARMDLNVVATDQGDIIEIQGTAEGEPVPRVRVDEMVDLALAGIDSLAKLQRDVLASAGIDLDTLRVAEGSNG